MWTGRWAWRFRRPTARSGIRGLRDIEAGTQDRAKASEGFIRGFGDSAADVFAEFARTGTPNVRSLVDVTLDQLARLAFRQSIRPGINCLFKLGAGFLRRLFGAPSAPGGIGAILTSHAGSAGTMTSYPAGLRHGRPGRHRPWAAGGRHAGRLRAAAQHAGAGMSIAWPAGMPGRMLRDGWGMVPQSPLKRSGMDDGSIAITRRFHRVRTSFPVRRDMTPVQFAVFRDFWLRGPDGGRAWFDAPVFTGAAEETPTIRFARIDPPWEAVSPRPDLIELRAELEIADLPVLTDAARTALEGRPGWLWPPRIAAAARWPSSAPAARPASSPSPRWRSTTPARTTRYGRWPTTPG